MVIILDVWLHVEVKHCSFFFECKMAYLLVRRSNSCKKGQHFFVGIYEAFFHGWRGMMERVHECKTQAGPGNGLDDVHDCRVNVRSSEFHGFNIPPGVRRLGGKGGKG